MLILLFLSGCVTSSSSIGILQNARVTRQFTRIYIVVHQGELDWYYAEYLRKALVDAFQPHTLAVAGVVLTGLELSESVEPEVEKFAADGVLVIKPIGGLLVQGGGSQKLTYYATIIEPKTGRLLWRARPRNEGAPIMFRERSRLTAADIVNALIGDGALQGVGSYARDEDAEK